MVITYFDSSPRKMETHIGVKRKMVDLAIKEFNSGIRCLENFSLRGRKKETTNPSLITDIADGVDEHIQIDPCDGRRLSKQLVVI